MKRILLIGIAFISITYTLKELFFNKINLFQQYEYFYILENIICVVIGYVVSRLVDKGLEKNKI